VEIEWVLGGSNHKIGFSFGRRGFSVQMLVASLYVSRTNLDPFGPEFGLRWGDGCLWINHPFERRMETRSADPWWRKVICLHVLDWLIGRPIYSEEKGVSERVFVPMPEGCYAAWATPSVTRCRRRWYWPDRVRNSVWLEIPGAIPHSGKGENSWDCGDDGLYGCGGDTAEDAIAHAVRSVLRARRRYGLDSEGTGRKPVLVLNEKVDN
jgi:hypothetical protein